MPSTGACADCPLAGGPAVDVAGAGSMPDIVLICGFPSRADAAAKTPFSRGRGTLLRRMMADLTRHLPKNRQPGVAYACAARCPLPQGADPAVAAVAVKQCSPRLLSWLDRAAPAVVVALGNAALAALGISGRVRELRGSIPELRLGLNRRVPVVVTHHILEADATPGLAPTVRADLAKALRLIGGDAAASLPEPDAALTPAAIREALDGVLGAVRDRRAADGKPVALALHLAAMGQPHAQGRVLAVGLSWAAGKALAFPFDHPGHPLSEPDFHAVRQGLERLLTSSDIRIAACDGKNLLEWLRWRYALAAPDCGYDVRLAEHVLEEDKGNYDITAILLERFPSLACWESERQRHLDEVGKQRDQQRQAEQEAHAAKARDALREWWLDISPDARLKCLAAWVEKGLLRLSETNGLREVRRIKRKGEWVIPQRFQGALKLLSRVPPEEAPGLRLPEASEPSPQNGESGADADLPLDVLLRDTGLKAAAMRLLIGDQLRRFAEDDARVADAGRRWGRRIATVPALRALHGISMPLSVCLAHMECHGVAFDRARASSCAASLADQRAVAQQNLFREAGREFNPAASAPDLSRILYEEMGLPVTARAKDGLPATDAATLAGLHVDFKLPFLEELLTLRGLEAAAKALESWLAASARDGRIHATFHQTGTVTHRVTCSNPNLQAIPGRLAGLNLKALFLPDSDNHVLYTADIAHADLRALAAYSRDAALLRALREGIDPHAMTAAEVTGLSYKDILAHKREPDSAACRARRIGKGVNFGVVFGITPAGLSRQLWRELGQETSEETCQTYLDAWFAAHPGVAAYITGTTSFVRRFHFTTSFTGRRRRFPLAAHTASQAAAMARQAVNARLQITTADLVAGNLVDLHNAILPMGGRVLLTVYDSLVFQLPKDAGNVTALLDRLITENTARRAPWLPVPWAYEAAAGPSCGETQPLED